MKKQLMIIGIILILLAVGLSGCNEDTSKLDEEKIIGSWTKRVMHEGSIESNTYIFYSNKTFKVTGSYENESLNINGTWNITNKTLYMTIEGETKTAYYKFSDNNKTLILTDKSGNVVKFIKE
ncbi:MAG: hypothetical protein MUO82_07435 [Candidatus Thermoplasmatota archaeon]|nr:hypothetical protein [Candidatus Thermoplasmatota archaeon]